MSRSEVQETEIMKLKRFLRIMSDGENWMMTMPELASRLQCKIEELLPFLRKFPNYFELSFQENVLTVKARTPLGYCRKHGTNAGSCDGHLGCSGLHICKFFLIHRNCKFKSGCKFGHDLNSIHNKALLKKHHFDNVSISKIKDLFNSQSGHKAEVTTIAICKFYNAKEGCTSDSERGGKESCPYLHICKHFVYGSCRFKAAKCRHNHDLEDPQVVDILEKHGIDSERSEEDILDDLREMLKVEKVQIAEIRMNDGENIWQSRSEEEKCKHDEYDATCIYICIYNLRDVCNFQQSCRDHHKSLIYQWQYRLFQESLIWIDFQEEQNIELEKIFCDPSKVRHWMELPCTHDILELDLVAWEGEDDRFNQLQLRRLTTPSSVLAQHDPLNTLWKWYWLSNKEKWLEYGETEIPHTQKKNDGLTPDTSAKEKPEKKPRLQENILQGKKQYDREFLVGRQFKPYCITKPTGLPDLPDIVFDEVVQSGGSRSQSQREEASSDEESLHRLKSDIDSETIEQAYQENPQGQITFSVGENRHVLDFRAMVQKNLENDIETDVRRRPVFITKEMVDKKKKQKLHRGLSTSTSASIHTLPSVWETEGTLTTEDSLFEHFRIVSVDRASKEFETVQSIFFQSKPEDTEIESIERIQNGDLWISYCREKEKMKKKLKLTEEEFKEKSKEMQLFHGTDHSHIDAICRQGFDFRLSYKSTGTRFGKGSYFASRAEYAGNFADNSVILLARVLVGDYVLGKVNYHRPPEKINHELYDSCVNNETNPDIFVIFDQYRTYPEYIIKY